MARPGRPRKHDPAADSARQAIDYSSTSTAIALLEKAGVNILDGEAQTPLMHAVIAGKKEVFEWLLANGADVNHQDRNGWSALHFAVSEKRAEFATHLLKLGACVHLQNVYGNTPLWTATFDARGKYDLVKLLLAYGANPNSKNKSNRSPLDMAHVFGDNELIAILSASAQEVL
jgi:ankyrin repeat protein